MTEKHLTQIEYLDHVEIKQKPRDVVKTKPVHCVIIGEVWKETPEYIIVTSYYEKDPGYDVDLDSYAMLILKSCIVSREELGPKEEKSHV